MRVIYRRLIVLKNLVSTVKIVYFSYNIISKHINNIYYTSHVPRLYARQAALSNIMFYSAH